VKKLLIGFSVLVAGLLLLVIPARAEDKPASGGMIPKLPKTADDPQLSDGHVYPFWGPVCQRYTYSVLYRDKEGREPEYVRMYFNGRVLDIEKADPSDNNYKQGVRYEYQFVPNKLGSNFYYFEASNGLGKTRASIIDSPDNGPVLFEGDFKDNEIVLVDGTSGEKVWNYPVGEEWVGGVALSGDGKYLAAQTSRKVYLFETGKSKPVWTYETSVSSEIGGDVKGGVAISGDGEKIVAALGSKVFLFGKKSNKPTWEAGIGNNSAYGVAISKDGKYLAAGTAGTESDQNSNLVILWQEKSNKPLWQYHAAGNFHEVSLSDNGEFLAAATGCPDRRAYIFSRDSNQPLVRTEMLTRDSPVDEAQIAGDGRLAAFGLESEAGGLVLLKNDSKNPVWRFNTPGGSSVRALAITQDGKHIAAATMGGSVYLFNEDSGDPVASWSLNGALGAVEISDDGVVLATGGTDNTVHLYHPQDTSFHREVVLAEYVGEIDVSANGKYVAAGTSGSTYFFESFNKNKEGKIFPCDQVIEPLPESQMMQGDNTSGKSNSVVSKLAQKLSFWERIVNFFTNIFKPNKEGVVEETTSQQPVAGQPAGNGCGNSYCEPNLGETRENCSQDCSAGD
jgi:WD40 repeat protein